MLRLNARHHVAQSGVRVECRLKGGACLVEGLLFVGIQRVGHARIIERIEHQEVPVGHIGLQLAANRSTHLHPARKRIAQVGMLGQLLAHRRFLLRRQIIVKENGFEEAVHESRRRINGSPRGTTGLSSYTAPDV